MIGNAIILQWLKREIQFMEWRCVLWNARLSFANFAELTLTQKSSDDLFSSDCGRSKLLFVASIFSSQTAP